MGNGLTGNQKIELLRRSPIFSGLDEIELKELANLAAERRFAAEEFVFREGDTADSFYIMAEGKVKVLKYSSTGRDFIIAFFGPGEMFGEVALFENKPYPASAQALTETRVLGIRREDFLAFMTNRPQVSIKIIDILGGRLREAQARLKDLAGERVLQRLAGVLVMLSSKMGANLPFTRQEIADMAGTTIETVIRILSQLKERGIIDSTRGQITILDAEKLRLLSEGAPQI